MDLAATERKEPVRRLPEGSVQGLTFPCALQGLSVHTAPSAISGGGTKQKQKQKTQGSEGLEKPGEKSPTVAFPCLMAQVFLPGCFGSKVSCLVTRHRVCPRYTSEFIGGFQATGKCSRHTGLGSVWMKGRHRSHKGWRA